MTWKLERDVFYNDLAKQHGRAFVEEAGFFEDTASADAPLENVRLLCTPLGRAASNLARAARPPAVLLCTGAYCPVHPGHVELMELARARVEQAGFSVIGGYLSPGHDEYLRLKLNDDATSAQQRLTECALAVRDSDWLDVDPWEALYCRVAVNFTDVLRRLGAYLDAHLGHQVTPFYAFGGDNARFSLTFAQRGHAVVVGRPGYADRFQHYRAHALNRYNPRVLWAESALEHSSTAIRETELQRNPRLRQEHPTHLSLRCEDASVAPGPPVAWRDFQQALVGLLRKWFVVELRTPDERQLVLEPSTISLDPLTRAECTIAISRLFELGGYAQKGYTARPGSPPLATQLSQIPPGVYDVLDDDASTGGTLSHVASLLWAKHSPDLEPGRSRSITIQHETARVRADAGAERREIADSRDFLLGADHAGLVMTLGPDALVRGIYAYPYVDPTARCSIPASEALEFSIAIWRLNETFHASTQNTVDDLNTPQRALLLRAGFGPTEPLSAVCRWHANQLENVRPPDPFRAEPPGCP